MAKDIDDEREEDLFLAWARRVGALVFVCLNTCTLVTVTGYSREQPGPMYLASTAVLASQLIKLPIILVALACEHGGDVWSVIFHGVFGDRNETLKLAVPALLYTCQDYLWLFALTYVGTATATVTSQLKVPATALFSVLMLGRRINAAQWGAILLLILGLLSMQLRLEDNRVTPKVGAEHAMYYAGLLAMVLSSTSSGYASVYLERLYKARDASVFVRNLQLLLFQVPISAASMCADYRANGQGEGLFRGWGWIVCLVVLLEAVGGFAAGFAMKYADNILKTFAVSISMVINCILGAFVLHERLVLPDCVGIALVVGGTWVYSSCGAGSTDVVPKAEQAEQADAWSRKGLLVCGGDSEDEEADELSWDRRGSAGA